MAAKATSHATDLDDGVNSATGAFCADGAKIASRIVQLRKQGFAMQLFWQAQVSGSC